MEETHIGEFNENEETAATFSRSESVSELDGERDYLEEDSPARVLTSSSPLRSEEHDGYMRGEGEPLKENEDNGEEGEDENEDEDDDDDQEDDEDYRKGIPSILLAASDLRKHFRWLPPGQCGGRISQKIYNCAQDGMGTLFYCLALVGLSKRTICGLEDC